MTMRDREKMHARLFLVLGVIFYICAFLFSYEKWVVPRYESWGMSYKDVPLGYTLASWAMCLISALWIPRDLTRPSQLLFLVQYFVIFIPTSFILYHSSKPEMLPEEVLDLVFVLFTGLTILQSSYKFPLINVKKYNLSEKYFWKIFWCGAVSLIIYLLTVFGGYFQLADFEGIYNVRSAAANIIEKTNSSFSGYAQTWLAGFILPFIFSIGIFRRKLDFCVMAAMGYLYLLGIGGSKSTMLALVYLSAIYFLVRKGGKNVSLRMAICLSGLLLFPVIFTLISMDLEYIKTWYIAIIHSRIFSIPQLSVGQYYNFFENHPLTYGSHINGINLIVAYPYDMDIPRTIGRYFYDAEITANVNMWAQDGIASFGLIGIPLVSAIAAIIFWIFDSISRVHDPRFVTVALGHIALSFANISLFTTIISGGLLWLILALYFFRKE